MNQEDQYECQFDYEDAHSTLMCNPMFGRDRFVINYLKNFDGKANVDDIAELSIGNGALTKAMLDSINNAKLMCFDISHSRLRFVKSQLEPRLTGESTQRVSFNECNFDTQFSIVSNEQYDVVIALDIMEHVFDVFGFVNNCQRILKDRGLLIIRVPNIAYIKHRVMLLFGKLPVTASWFETPGEFSSWRLQHGWDGGHLHLFTIPIIYKLLHEYGFQVELCRDPGTKYSKVRDFWPNLLYSNPLVIARKTLK